MDDLGESHFSRDEANREIVLGCEYWRPLYMNLTVKGNQFHNYKRDKIFCDGLFRLDTQRVFKQNGRSK